MEKSEVWIGVKKEINGGCIMESDFTIKDFIEDNYYIKDKEGNLVKIKFNFAQNEFYNILKDSYKKKPTRIIVLKARQLGISTVTEAVITALTTMQQNASSVIVAHVADASSNLYEMTKLFIEKLPDGLRPKQKYDNRRMMVFDNEKGTGLKSSIRVMMAGDSTRSATYKMAHLSEVAFWEKPEDTMKALLQTIPSTDDSLVVVESTANGFNYFYNLWQDASNGRNDFIPLFLPWYVDPKYSMPIKEPLVKTPYEIEIQERFSLTDEQLNWRRWCIKNNCSNDEQTFRQEYPITPEEAFIVSGSSVFNGELILEHMKRIDEPIKTGYFTYDYDGLYVKNIKWVDDERGYIKIYKDRTDLPTAMGGDTAGEGEDFFTAQVLDQNGFLCATLHNQFDEDLYTKQIYCLGVYYHSLIAIETNFSTFPIMELKRLRYPSLYIRPTNLDGNFRDDSQEKYGFKTTSITRPHIIAQLVEIARESIGLINDRETLQEMLSFVKIKGKPQASEGAHDDLVMGLAIAYECLTQLPTRKINIGNKPFFKQVERKEVKNDDMSFFDYGM